MPLIGEAAAHLRETLEKLMRLAARLARDGRDGVSGAAGAAAAGDIGHDEFPDSLLQGLMATGLLYHLRPQQSGQDPLALCVCPNCQRVVCVLPLEAPSGGFCSTVKAAGIACLIGLGLSFGTLLLYRLYFRIIVPFLNSVWASRGGNSLLDDEYTLHLFVICKTGVENKGCRDRGKDSDQFRVIHRGTSETRRPQYGDLYKPDPVGKDWLQWWLEPGQASAPLSHREPASSLCCESTAALKHSPLVPILGQRRVSPFIRTIYWFSPDLFDQPMAHHATPGAISCRHALSASPVSHMLQQIQKPRSPLSGATKKYGFEFCRHRACPAQASSPAHIFSPDQPVGGLFHKFLK
ncbi:hypothetical protein RRG08_006276 [Elysia crispata]|uniref:Uncharacterized protein n=1 Tax=Elysia crispata TaxID=231223 RepID=A0AAE0YQM4_9GAST|nr:hypothetical protein RRG08_006276 [Elysia crispata]